MSTNSGMFKKNNVPWNKGVTGYTTSWKGRHQSEQTKKKISEIHKSKRYSPATEFKKGEGAERLSKKHRKKIAQALTGKSRPRRVREKISRSLKGHTPWNKGKSFMPKEFYQRIGLLGIESQANSNKPTSIEKKLYQELKKRGLLFEKQKLINGKFLVDAYVPSLNLVIEADGDYWHSLESVKKRDKAKNAYLKICGFNLLRLTETEIRDGTFKEKLEK